MAYFEWKDSYSVGINKIDTQHQTLVNYLNDLYESMNQGKGKEILGNVIDGLIQYTKSHFASEESLMKVYHYPGYLLHKEKHEKMAAHVLKLKQKFDHGEISNPIQITNFLKEWLAKHIVGTDKEYGPFLNQKGVK
jgi:hemerythrin